MFRSLKYLIIVLLLVGEISAIAQNKTDLPEQFIVILGIAQDAGYPQSACEKECCKAFWEGKETKKLVSCLGIVDRSANQIWMLDATPDFKEQLKLLKEFQTDKSTQLIDGIFITHAHIGHYTGLMDLGREAIGSDKTPVYAMPRMKSFLQNNGPWSQLVNLNNIVFNDLKNESTVQLNDNINITPFLVPHRDEFSETVGYKISGPKKSAIFIPDIDKWNQWDKDITQEIAKIDYAFLDGTFYKNGELPNRDMSLIPHPFIEESIQTFSKMEQIEKAKIFFIHFNHTNPLLKSNAKELKELQEKGLNIANEKQIFGI